MLVFYFKNINQGEQKFGSKRLEVLKIEGKFRLTFFPKSPELKLASNNGQGDWNNQ